MIKLENRIIRVFILYIIFCCIYIVFYNSIITSVFSGLISEKTLQELNNPIFVAVTVLFVVLSGRFILKRIYANERKCEELTSMLNLTPAILFTTDDNGRIVQISDYCLKAMGYSRNEVIGRMAADFLSKESKDYFDKEIASAYREIGIINNSSYKIITKSGKAINILLSSVAEKSKSGDIIRTLNVATDITEFIELENALFESKDFYRKIIYAMPDICIQTDLVGEIVYVNEIGQKIFESYSTSNVIGRNILSFVATEDQAKAISNIHLMLEKTLGPIEYNVVMNDSSRLTCETNGQVLLRADNTQYGMVFVIRDVTQRKKVEKELKEGEEKFRAIVETSPNMIWEILPDGRFTYASPKCYDVLGYHAEELYNMRFFDLIVPEEIPRITKQFNKDINARKNLMAFEVIGWHGVKNQKIFLEVNTALVLNEAGGVTGLRGTVRDISVRKQSELDLKESKEQVEMILKVGGMGLWHVNVPQRSISIDSHFASFLGYPIEETTGIKYDQLKKIFHPDDLQSIDKFFYSVYNGDTTNYSIEHRMLTKQGDIKWVLSVAKVVKYDSENKPLEILGLLRDITERKNYELKIVEANATKDKLFSIIAHDLKNPFSTILGFSELLSKNINTYNTQKIAEMVHHINSSSKSLYFLLENLLGWANSQKGRTPFNPQNLLLEKVIEEEIDYLRYFAMQKDVAINQFHNALNVFADYNQLKIIIRNLITNAIKYSEPGESIDVCSTLNNGWAEVTISDNGIGMSDEIKSKIFTLDKTKSQKGTANESGTGLGLVLCKEFVDNHKGRIWVDSTPREGSKFTFTIPIQPDGA